MGVAVDYEMLPFVETCLILQSVFLNILWIVLLFGWVAWNKKHPQETLAGGMPSRFHWIAAFGVGALTLSVAIYFFEPTYWLLGLAIANGAFLSVLNPALALCFTMSMIMMRPWEIMINNDLMLEVPRFSMFFSMAWSMFYVAIVDRFRIRFNAVVLILLAYAIWVLLSTVVTPNPALAVAGVNETISRAVVLFLLVYTLIRDKFSVWALKVSLTVIFTCVGLIAIVFYFDGYTDGGRIIAFGIFKNTNDAAAVMTILFPLAMSPFLRRNTSKLAMLMAMPSILVASSVLLLAQSRGAIASLGAAVCIYAFRKVKNKTFAIAAVCIILSTAMLATKIFKRSEGDLEGSSASRKSFLISGVRMAMYNPVFGVGYGEFPSNFEYYATEISHEYGKRTAHSSWVLALAEGGTMGLLLFGLFFGIGAVRNGYSIAENDPSWLYAAIAYGVCMSFLSHTYMLFPYILVAAITVATRNNSMPAHTLNI